jgi:hypothetical protein
MEKKNTFQMDPFLLKLEVCSFHIHSFESANLISRESENTVMANQGQGVVEFVEENEM